MGSTDSNGLVKLVAIGAGVVILDKVVGIFTPDKPGGDVTPGTGDNRPATFDVATARALADRLESDFWPGGLIALPFEYDEDAAATLMQCQVTNDVRLLMNEYGTRGTAIFERYNLTETVVKFLDNNYRDAVNADYQTKGITIRF